jgi:hypothetical protein
MVIAPSDVASSELSELPESPHPARSIPKAKTHASNNNKLFFFIFTLLYSSDYHTLCHRVPKKQKHLSLMPPIVSFADEQIPVF